MNLPIFSIRARARTQKNRVLAHLFVYKRKHESISMTIDIGVCSPL